MSDQKTTKVQAACVPVALFQAVVERLRNYPHREVDDLIQALKQCQIVNLDVANPPEE